MAFKKNCNNLDQTKGFQKIVDYETIKGTKQHVGQSYVYCVAEEIDDWISECPENCKYFLPK